MSRDRRRFPGIWNTINSSPPVVGDAPISDDEEPWGLLPLYEAEESKAELVNILCRPGLLGKVTDLIISPALSQFMA